MRCVDKGAIPLGRDGQAVEFPKYQLASSYLLDRIGRFCSYCERSVPVSLAVEHKRPKHLHPLLERAWSNFLLSCANCNSSKGKRDNEHGLWPDSDDTFSPLEYLPSGRIRPKAGLPEAVSHAVASLLTMTGLDKTPQLARNSDHRWTDRLEIWGQATQSLEDRRQDGSQRMRDRIIQSAKNIGGFSIWMAAFVDDPEMRQALVQAFPGTRMHKDE